MLSAAKHFDPVLGVDIHIIITPAGVPVPIPHPHIGFIFDPFDYAPIIGSTINVNGVPRATAGTGGRTVPGIHFPIGGSFAKPPGNEHEMFLGSSTVVADGDPFSYLALPALSCHDIGMIAPFRARKKGKIKSLSLPTSVVLPIPLGMPVLVGGPPTISMMAMGMKFGLAALGRIGKAARRSKLGQALAGKAKSAWKGLFKNMDPGFLKCKVLRAEPVDITTGEVVVEQQDFSLPGRLPILWNRYYRSNSDRIGVCGYGWETPADIRLKIYADGSLSFHDGGPGAAVFLNLPLDEGPAGAVRELRDGALLWRADNKLFVRTKADRIYQFGSPTAAEVSQLSPEQRLTLLVESISDRCGNTATMIRHGKELSAIDLSDGRKIIAENENGLIRGLWLSDPRTKDPVFLVGYQHDNSGDLLAVIDALGNPYKFAYQAHHLTRHTDRNGLSFHYKYDPRAEGWQVVHAWGDGGLYNYGFVYDDNLGERQVTDSLGQVSTIKLDENGLPILEIDPLGGNTIFEYDELGRTVAVVDPSGYRTEYEYDECGNLLKLIRPDGTSVETQFDEDNKAIAILDPNGARWQQKWNGQGLLLEQISPLGHLSHYDYDSLGQLIRFTNPRGAETKLVFDSFGNLAELTNALGHNTRFAYDLQGNLIGKLDPVGHKIIYRYDTKARLTNVRLPSGAEIRCAYDNEDNLVLYIDENSAETKLEYFGLGEIAKRIQPDGHTVEYLYDTEERLIGVRNQRGEVYQLKRDALGRIIEEVDYWGQARRYAYDAGGYLQSSTDPLGRCIRYATDPLGRILKKTLPDGFIEDFAYDANGNLVAAKNAHGTIKREFDPEGHLLKEMQGAFTITNAYDANGNRIARETSLGNAVVYEFDALDQVSSIRINQEQPIRIHRNTDGSIAREKLSSQLSRRFSYSADGYLTEQAIQLNESPLFSTRFEYDKAGNLTQRNDSQYGTDVYRYDPLGRIVEHLDPQRGITRYLNDPAGDRLKTRIVEGMRQRAVGESVVESDWSREGKYEGVYYRFDRAGNLVERRDGQRDLYLVWDANQRLIESHANGMVTRYGYDPLGRRLFKEAGDKRTQFYWDGDALVGESVAVLKPLEELKSAGEDNVVNLAKRGEKVQAATLQKLREYVYYPDTFEPSSLIDCLGEARHIYHYHNDPNGCPTRLTDVNGEVKWGASYTAWNAISNLHINDVDNPIRLQGQYADEETGLYLNRNRYFEPCTGQFISNDPIGLHGGLNTYEFGPNSLNWADPLGLSCKSLVHVDGGYEYFYRAMSKSDFEDFLKTGRLRATTETFISPTRKFSEGYQGVLVKFQVASGTTDALRGMGVRAHGAKSAALLPDLPQVKRGWGKNKALFKPEGDQINIGLGKGKALDTFNDSIKGFEILGVN